MIDRRPVLLEDGWALVETTIQKIQAVLESPSDKKNHIDAETWANTYSKIYELCTQKPPHDYSEQLYNAYRNEFKRYIEKTVIPALCRAKTDEGFVQELIRRWDNHVTFTRFMGKFFNYLDRYYVPRHQVDPLRLVPMKIFKELVYDSVKGRARTGVLKMVHKDRLGEMIDGGHIKAVVQVFVQMGLGNMEVYEKDLEEQLIQETSEFYRGRASSWLAEDSCPEYLKKAEAALQQEEGRVHRYQVESSKRRLLQCVEEEILSRHRKELLEKENSGCAALLANAATDDLRRMFTLFARISDGLGPMSEIFKQHIQGQGTARLRAVADEIAERKGDDKGPKAAAKDASLQLELELVRSVIDLHQRYMEYVSGCFSSHTFFHRALKDAFENFCNKPVGQASFAELMATFCDTMLRKGGSDKMSDEATEEVLERVIKLIAYISDKDLFGDFYRRKLARRLLQDKSTSEEHERLVLSALKEQCGAQFTQKMEGMVRDLQLARDKASDFDQWRSTTGTKLSIDVGVTVLTTGFWPSYKTSDFSLPPEMEQCVEAFRQFYDASNKHRKLQWVHTLGLVTVKSRLGGKYYDVMTAPQQAAVLSLFNDEESLGYEEIQQRLGMADEELLRSLHSLSCTKYKLLIKTPESKKVDKTDRFAVNDGFKDKMKRIRVPLPQVEDRRKVLEEVTADRKPAIEAAIVRVMKMRKVLQHQQLMIEVRQQMQSMFEPEMKLVKKCVEGLIEREYLERDAENPSLYKYLA